MRLLVLTALAVLVSLPAAARPGWSEKQRREQSMTERFLPIEGMIVVCDSLPSEAEILAVRRFVGEIKRITSKSLPTTWGDYAGEKQRLIVGNRSTLGRSFETFGYRLAKGGDTEDIRNQSYVVDAPASEKAKRAEVLAAGFGAARTARGSLGTSYALGELLRRLDIREKQWGFVLPAKPILASPRMPSRTLYLMNSNNCNPGLSLEYYTDAQIEDYVDCLVEARYSRICFWQWSSFYLYPGNAEEQRDRNRRIHLVMRKVFDRARRRGLEIYHQLTPAHATVELLPKDPKFTATGYYGRTSVCWSQPEARELARKMAQTEMEYFGPVDGYMVWFYDPGGCFCQDCATRQSERIFDQLMTVVDLAKSISPGAKFQAALWPTWAFAAEKARIGYPGKGYTDADVKALVEDFLGKCLAQFGPRGLTILDSCEADNTNIYNGFVKPEAFQRSAFMYSALGMASEQSYPFAGFKIKYLCEQMGKARECGIDEGMLFIQYTATNFPGVFAFADALYEENATRESVAQRLAATLAKGDSRKPFLALLTAMDELAAATRPEEREKAVKRAEEAGAQVARSRHFVGDRDWLTGYVRAQRHYLQLAQAGDEKAFAESLARFQADLAAIPMYKDYASRSLTPKQARAHLTVYWPAPTNH